MLHLARPFSLAFFYAARRQEPDIWESERTFARDFSAKQWERIRRRDAKRGTSIDDTHPPTNLRIDLLKSGPTFPARLEIAADKSALIAAEMASGYALVGERIVSRYAS